MTKIFISYSSKDRERVDALAGAIDVMFDDVAIWYDRELNRSGGHQWWSLICEEIRQCDLFIYALSTHVLASEPCKREYGYAKALSKPILPVMIDEIDIRYLPKELQATQLVNFRQRSFEQQKSLRLSIRNQPPAPDLPANARDLAPEAPLDPVGVLLDRITNLTTDPQGQALLILELDDLQEDAVYGKFIPEVLERLVRRDDVLTARNLRRAQELLGKVVPPSPPAVGTGRAPSVASTPSVIARTSPDAGARWTDPYGVPMVYVPAGTFLMGSTTQEVDAVSDQAKKEFSILDMAWYEHELPQHDITIERGFWLDLTPVTNESYARFVGAGGYQNSALWTEAGWNWVQKNNKTAPNNYDGFTTPQQPRVGVTWYEAYAYCQWREGRLPTEAEWEWAVRGAENHYYPWGNTFDANRVIYHENSGGKSSPVGAGVRKAGASWVGALDMSGNVWEWVNSLLISYPYRADDGRESLGDGTGSRVVRGGSWKPDDTTTLRASFRNGSNPNLGFNFVSFRCVRS